MSLRMLTVALMVLAAAWAQPGPGRGRGAPGDARFVSAEAGMPGPLVKGAPYSADAITETTQMLPDGNRIRQVNTVRIYRDGEGRTRREQSLNGIPGLGTSANLPSVVFITDPVSGVNFALNSRDRAATKTVWGPVTRGSERGGGQHRPDGRGPDIRGDMPRREGGPSMKSEALGQKLIEGIPAEGTRTTVTIAAGQIGNEQPLQIVSETWFSAELRTVVMSRRSDPRSGETVFRLSNLSRSEPPRSLFEVPADYKVMESSRGSRGGGQSRN
jgi:hypothetical protein